MSVIEVVMTSDDFNKIVADRFNMEWNGAKRKIPYSEVLKNRSAINTVNDGFKLPVKNEGDNLTVANLALVQLISYLNDHIERMNVEFDELLRNINLQATNQLTDISTSVYRVRINSEIFAYLLKTAIDKIIVLLAQAYDEKNVDSIGSLLTDGRIEKFCDGLFIDKKNFLDEINGLHNAYKHTFSNLQLMSIVPRIEPTMIALYKMNNSISKPSRMYHMICSNAVDAFNELLVAAQAYAEERATT